MTSSTGGSQSVTTLSATGLISAATSGSGDAFKVGDDALLVDIGQSNTIGLQGVQNRGEGRLVFGLNGPTLSGTTG